MRNKVDGLYMVTIFPRSDEYEVANKPKPKL